MTRLFPPGVIVSLQPIATLPLPLDQRQQETLGRLPRDLVAGLLCLLVGAAPVSTDTATWRDMGFDAALFAADGWAQIAIGLGWSPLDLFGCSTQRVADDRFLGVAARIAGRRVGAITGEGVLVRHGPTNRLLSRPRTNEPRIFLWEAAAIINHPAEPRARARNAPTQRDEI